MLHLGSPAGLCLHPPCGPLTLPAFHGAGLQPRPSSRHRAGRAPNIVPTRRRHLQLQEEETRSPWSSDNPWFMVCKVLADYLIVEKLNQCSSLWSGSAVQGLSNTASHEHSCDPHPCSAPQNNIWSSEKSSLACSWGQDNELLGWLKKSFRTAGEDLMKAEPEVFSYQKQWLLAKQLYKIKLNQSHSLFGANCLSATAPALLSSIKNKGKWEKRHFGKEERSTVWIWAPILSIELHSLRLLSDLWRNIILYIYLFS